MPILPKEPMCHPEDLFDPGLPGEERPRSWWVLHTKPRQEKSLARDLLGLGVPYFLPQYGKPAVNRGKPVQVHMPLFPGYVFLYGDPEERVTALGTNRVANVLPVPDQAELGGELAQVYKLLQAGMPVSEVGGLVPGASVEIRTGPLAGLRGKVMREGNRGRFWVEVHFIGRAAAVDLDAGYLTILA